MKKLNTALVTVLSLVIISGVMFNTVSFASSIGSSTQTNKSSNSIPKSVLRSARIYGETTVLGKTKSQFESILSSHDLRQVLDQTGLTPKIFREDVRTEISSYLTEQGYTQTQITSALDSRYIRTHRNNI